MPPTKRQRTDGEPDEPNAIEVVRSDIWFEDGNIILQVLKAAIEDVADEKGVDGCPLLLLSDSSLDMTYVLRTMFHPWSYPENAPWPFKVIVAFLRLGRKYEMKPLHDIALARLTMKRGEIVIDSIVLARQLGLLALLPSAFWYFSTRIESLGNRDIDCILRADRDALFSGVVPLRVAYANYLFGWLDETVVSSPKCALPESCGLAKGQHSLRLWKPPGLPMLFVWDSGAELGLCRYCVAVGKKHHSEGAKRLWKELPSFFGLPPWEELLAGAPDA
ncbi:hypothetical protein DFH06DRAFT_1487247 [Mycena polygramma]|nr:hypothetical protein DFH06DRAFT_1487247 [Mycena polygramma]